MTNADKIRAMTDEELAYVVMCQYGQCPDRFTCEEAYCFRCSLDWLKQEVSDNG